MKSKEYIDMCLNLEKMAGMIKDVWSSKEYKNGVRLQAYLELLKEGKVLEIVKRLTNNTASLNGLLKAKDFQFDNSPDRFQSNERIAVYTALFGKYDVVAAPMVYPDNIDYYLITDNEMDNTSGWKQINPEKYFPSENMSNIEKNRFFKMMPHLIFPEYKYSIYVDSNVVIVSDLTPMVNAIAKMPIAMFKHKNRDCVYEEAEACIKKKKDSRENLERHIQHLKKNGVPKHAGLLEATIIVREHHAALCKTLMEQWWKEFNEFSKRDQLSLRDVLWNNNIDLDEVGVLGNNLFRCNKFLINKHL